MIYYNIWTIDESSKQCIFGQDKKTQQKYIVIFKRSELK